MEGEQDQTKLTYNVCISIDIVIAIINTFECAKRFCMFGFTKEP